MNHYNTFDVERTMEHTYPLAKRQAIALFKRKYQQSNEKRKVGTRHPKY
jgi:hypothetical protein